MITNYLFITYCRQYQLKSKILTKFITMKTMKNNLKNLTIKVILFFTLIFYFNSCEKNENEYLTENSDEIQKIISRKTSLEDISNFSEVSKVLNKIDSKLNEKSSLKKSPLDFNGVKILTNDILHMKYAETHTYTFKIVREKPLHFIENIVLHYNVDKKNYDEYLIQYNLTSKEYQDVLNGFPLDKKGKVDIYELESGTLLSLSNKGTCYRVCQTISVPCTGSNHHQFGDSSCPLANDPDKRAYQYQSCGSFCLDDNPAIVTEEPDSNTGGGGGGGSTNPNSVIVTNPNTTSCDSSSTSLVGDINDNGCSVTTENITRNTLFSRLSSYLTSQQQADWIGLYADIATIELLNNFLDESSFTNKDKYREFTSNLVSVIMSDNITDINALEFTLEAFRQNKIYNDLDSTFLNSINQFLNIDTTDANIHDPIVIHFMTKMAVIRATQPNICNGLSGTQCDLKVFWEATKDVVHIVLDGVGLIPVVGEVADLINGGLYLLEGDGVNATLSFAATIPFAGWSATGAKYAIKIVDATQTASTLVTKVKLTWKVLSDGTIYFGSNSTCRRQLRKALGLAPYAQDARQAHHIIPLNLQTNPVVQKAAKSENAFHLNETLNGIPLNNLVHNGSHANYDKIIFQKLESFRISNPNATPNQSFNKVAEIIQQIRTAIINNPNTPVNQLIF